MMDQNVASGECTLHIASPIIHHPLLTHCVSIPSVLFLLNRFRFIRKCRIPRRAEVGGYKLFKKYCMQHSNQSILWERSNTLRSLSRHVMHATVTARQGYGFNEHFIDCLCSSVHFPPLFVAATLTLVICSPWSNLCCHVASIAAVVKPLEREMHAVTLPCCRARMRRTLGDYFISNGQDFSVGGM